MGFNWLDLLTTAAPIAASAIGTPALGMAVGAGMQGLKSGIQGGSLEDMLKSAALGAGSAAAGNAISGAMPGLTGAAEAASAAPMAGASGFDAAINSGISFAPTEQFMSNLTTSLADRPVLQQTMFDRLGLFATGADGVLSQMQKYGNYAAMGQQIGGMLGVGGQAQPPMMPSHIGGMASPGPGMAPNLNPLNQLTSAIGMNSGPLYAGQRLGGLPMYPSHRPRY